MENKPQGDYSTPVSNAMEPRASNMYFLQVKPSNSEGSIEADAIPLHMLINEQDPQNDQYFIQVLEGKQLQLFIDSRQASTSTTTVNNQYYNIPAAPQEINAEFQGLNNDNSVPSQSKMELGSDTVPSCNQTKHDIESSCNGERKKKPVQRFVHIADRLAPPRAEAVLPPALQLRRARVAPRRALPPRVRFGPAEGIKRNLSPEEVEALKTEYTNSGLPVFLLKSEEGSDIHIDVSDKDKANWLSLLPLGDQSTANVWLYQEEHELYAATTRPLPSRAPLALGYSAQYVRAHGLRVQQPVLDLDADAEVSAMHRQWWCHSCQRPMSSAALLQRHVGECHSEEKPRARRYRCNHCTRSFCRLFTLRRHVARHCTNKKQKEKNDETETTNGVLESSKPDELGDLSVNPPAEDSRLPSDESLQTLHSLDFSTNLFDTERLTLDMSGSSRSEDFNPYSLGLKDDIGLAASIDFGIDVPCSKKEVKTENTETVYLTCRYCNQAVIRGRQRQHVKACTGRKFRCECGRAFQYRDKLALHIHADHAHEPADQRKKNTKEDEMQYKCETCNHNFKRRGMLVNHLWRVHNTSTAVPLEKRVRRYPCAACPKLYRTAAKRDRHVTTHHPGWSGSAGAVISCGRVAAAPAACAACPRQYASRAKLLQHVRRQHPALAPPVKKKVSLK